MDRSQAHHLTFGPEDRAGAIDALAIHLYASEALNTAEARRRTIRQYEALTEVLRDKSAEDTRRWITEIGFPTKPFGEDDIPERAASEPRQCKRLRDLFVRFAMLDKVDAFVVHRLIDVANPRLGDQENDFGVIRTDGSKKPAFEVLRKLAKRGGEHEEVRCP